MGNPNQNPEQIARDKIDAFLIGLIATPNKRTFGFFNENVVDYTPFDAKGGRGKMHQLFGDEMTSLIHEFNEMLAA